MLHLNHQPDTPAPAVVPGLLSPDRRRFEQLVPAVLVVANRQRLKELVLEALESGARDVVLDMSACEYVDASGCGVLISIAKKTRDAGGELQLQHLTDDVRTIFEITKLDTLFTYVR